MAVYLEDVSRTFGEYLLIPGLTTKLCTPVNVSLKTPLVKHPAGEKPLIELNIPFVSAIMQAVSGPELAIELARNGGLSFIFGSQPVESQAEMVRKVKKFKAGFVISDSNLTPEHTLADVVKLVKSTGHSTIGITDDGTSNGTLLGIVTSRDYRTEKDSPDMKVKEFMTPFPKLIVGQLGITLSEANQILWEHRLNSLPIIDKDQNWPTLSFGKIMTAIAITPTNFRTKQRSSSLAPVSIRATIKSECRHSSKQESTLSASTHPTAIPNGNKRRCNGSRATMTFR